MRSRIPNLKIIFNYFILIFRTFYDKIYHWEIIEQFKIFFKIIEEDENKWKNCKWLQSIWNS